MWQAAQSVNVAKTPDRMKVLRNQHVAMNELFEVGALRCDGIGRRLHGFENILAFGVSDAFPSNVCRLVQKRDLHAAYGGS